VGIKQKHIAGFDTIRFVAATVVVFCHIEIVKHYRGLPALVSLPLIYETGKLAVAAFFALSGFLITLLLLTEKAKNGTIRLSKFYARRGLRIFPLYYLTVLITLFVLPKFSAFYLPVFSEDLQQHFAAKTILTLLLLPQMVLVKFSAIPAGEQLWTIGAEEIFYFLWPVLLTKTKNEWQLTVGLIVVFVVVKFLLRYFSGAVIWNEHPGLIYRIFLIFYYNRIDCLLLGAGGAVLFYQKPAWLPKFAGGLKNVLAVVLLLAGCFVLGFAVLPVDFFFYSLCFAFVLWVIAASPSKTMLLQHSITEYLGKVSYGIYLWHYMMVLVAFALLNCFFDEATRNSFTANLFLYAAAYGFTLMAAIASYTWFERPFLKLKEKFNS